jgi:uncharacterized membrane protein YcaP (DUF421 family)
MEPYVFDLQRIFFGDFTWGFALEVIFRTVLLYLYALFLSRFVMGPRGVGQLSHFEYLIIIALGSAVGDPMFYPDIPLVHGILVITLILAMHRATVWLSNKNEHIEAFIEGRPLRLVKDGQIDLDGMNQAALSREEVFMELRLDGIRQLGEVERAYMEVDGKVSTFPFDTDQIRPGLPIVPPWDLVNDRPRTWKLHDAAPQTDDYACRICGEVRHFKEGEKFSMCENCQRGEWMLAVQESLKERQAFTMQESGTR